MRSIILVGYMCVGKTTLGHQLARGLGWPFYDLDQYIERRFHLSVPQLFEERGEEGFRDLERRMLHEVAEFENIVLASGGGTPCYFDNMDYMIAQGTTVYLRARPETIISHLQISHIERPLLKGKNGDALRAHIEQQLEERRPYYERAHKTFDVDLLDTNEKIKNMANHIKDVLTNYGKMEN